MKKAIIIVTLLASGCGTSLGFLRDSTTSQTFNYEMNIKKLSMQRTVSASTEAKTLVCLIPTDGDPPYATAMKRLHQEAKLGPNEVLVNIREDKRILVYLIYCKHRLTLSADVYKLGEGPAKEALRSDDVASEAPAKAVKAQEPTPKPKKKKEDHPCDKQYWKCMEHCGTRGCGPQCFSDKEKCYRKGKRHEK